MGRKKISRYAFAENGSIEEKLERALRLFELEGAAYALKGINEIAVREKLTFYQFLERLLEEEMHKKEDLRIERWKKQAKFPRIVTMEGYNFDYPDKIDKQQIIELTECLWVNNGWNVIFLGPTGVGKTHLSIALGLKAIEKNYETRFTTIERLGENLNRAIVEDKEESGGQHRKKLLHSLSNVTLLIIDEMAHTLMTDEVKELLRQIILRRHEARKSIIITANTKPSEWGKHFGDDQTRTAAIIDRLLEGVVINIEGETYRQENVKKRLKKKDDKQDKNNYLR